MKKSATAALLSACLFPGVGHLYVRSYGRGILLLLIAAAALLDFIRRAWQQVELIRAQLTDEINASGFIDLSALVDKTIADVHRIDQQPFTIATLVLTVCWIVGILDSYRIGKKFEEDPISP